MELFPRKGKVKKKRIKETRGVILNKNRKKQVNRSEIGHYESFTSSFQRLKPLSG